MVCCGVMCYDVLRCGGLDWAVLVFDLLEERQISVLMYQGNDQFTSVNSLSDII